MICSEVSARKKAWFILTQRVVCNSLLTIMVESALCVVSSGFSSPNKSIKSMTPVSINAIASSKDATAQNTIFRYCSEKYNLFLGCGIFHRPRARDM